MKLLIIGDEESKFIWDFFKREAFDGVEAVISAGDLKLDYLEFVATMIPVPLFYVPGNHDKRFAKQPPGGCVSVDGKIEVCKGVRIAGLGGCQSPRANGVFELSEKQMAKRVKRLLRQSKNNLDIFVSHAPTLGLGDGDDMFHRGFACFTDILDTAKPKLHIFGHQHPSYSSGRKNPLRYKETLLYNAFGYKIIEIAV